MVASSYTRPAQPAVSLSCSPSSIRCLPGPTMRPRPIVVAKIPAAFLSPGLQGIVASAHHTAHYIPFPPRASPFSSPPPREIPHPLASQEQRCKRVAARVASPLVRPRRRRQCAPRRPSQRLQHSSTTPPAPTRSPDRTRGPCMTAVHEDQNCPKGRGADRCRRPLPFTG